jgi:hypothetical protein
MADLRVNSISPGRMTDFSIRGTSSNVSRGDSLIYSEDSADVRNLLQGKLSNHQMNACKTEPHTPNIERAVVLRKPCCERKINESMASEDSLRYGDNPSESKNACCVIQ